MKIDKTKILEIYYKTERWFNIYWYQYLFSKADDPKYTTWWRRLRCRMKGHPNGCWYYNPGGSEPDYTCKDCGDQLG